MASGSVKGSIISGHYTIRVDWSTIDNVANNSSQVKATMYLVQDSTWSLDIWSRECAIWVNGTKYTFNSPTEISNGGGVITKLGSITTNAIAHNADGSKKTQIAAEFNIQATISGTYYSKITIGNTDITLTTLPRATTPTLSASSVNMGSTVTINTPRASSAFTHDLAYSFAGAAYVSIATGVGTSYSWTVPDLASKIPNATSGTVTIRCITKHGSTTIGTKTVTLTAKVPTSVVPTISSVTLAEATAGLAAQFGTYIRNKSAIKATITAAGAKGSTIKSYSTTFLGKTYSFSSWTTGVLGSSGTLSMVTTVTDSRGRTAKKTTTVTVLDYSAPVVSVFTAYRCDAEGAVDDDGEYVFATYDYSAPSLNGGNTLTAQIQKKTSTGTTWETVHTLSGLSGSGSVTLSGFDIDSSWDVRLRLVDYFGTEITRSVPIPSDNVIADIKADGKGFSFFKVSNRKGVDVGGDQYIDGRLQRSGNKYVFSSPGVAGSAGYVLIAQIEVVAANADTPLTFVLTRRLAAAPMHVYVRFKNVNTLTPTVESVTYEGDNYGAFLVQLDDSVWGLYVQKVSAYDTITICDWYTSHTMSTRVELTFPGTRADSLPDTYYRATPAKLQSLLDYIYPVGSIHINYSHVSPSTLFGGTWERISNAFLWATDASGTIGQTGGEKTHTLTTNELPVHSHALAVANTATGTADAANTARYNSNDTSYVGSVSTKTTGGGAAHNNMPPFIQVSVWRRTA